MVVPSLQLSQVAGSWRKSIQITRTSHKLVRAYVYLLDVRQVNSYLLDSHGKPPQQSIVFSVRFRVARRSVLLTLRGGFVTKSV